MKHNTKTKNSTGRLLKGVLYTVLLAVLLGSCEQIFTYSPLSWAQRDPADLPDAQKIAYAENILGSGDPDAMADAYEAIKDSSDPDVQYLASQLAIGASGLNEAATEILESLDTIDETTLQSILDEVDDDMLLGAIAAMDAAEADSSTKENITAEDYLVTAAAILLAADVDVTDPAIYTDPGYFGDATADKDSTDPYDKALYYLDEAGYTAEDLEDILNFG